VRSRLPPLWASALAGAGLALLSTAALAQTAYKYRDSDGNWVFSDRTGPARAGEAVNLGHPPEGLHIDVEQHTAGQSTQFVGTNGCLCAITLRLVIVKSELTALPSGSSFRAALDPGESKILAASPGVPDRDSLKYQWTAVLGSPSAVHTPPRPYRAPFPLAETHVITQAYPMRATHVTPDSQYAVDIGLPDGTPIHAAREGIVINLRHDSFRGGVEAALLDQANVVEILHDDGTIAVYAHLHWDSIQVHVGQRVALGQYIANSGNTGFTSGPHLHFAVLRNAGNNNVSVPIQFAGMGGVAVTPVASMPLTAY